jgi:acetolactate synthase small subunit
MGRVTATYRFRLEVLDQPGLLARVTDALAAAGGNVESLDIHQPHKGLSVDEIAVRAPESWDMVAVAATLDALDGVRVVQQRRDRTPGDPIVNALRWARVMVVADPAEHELELTRAILEVTGASVAWTAPAGAATRSAAGYAALVARAPVIKRADAFPEDLVAESVPEDLSLPYWLLAAGDDPDEPGLVAFAARPLATPFSVSETARLEALLRLRRALARRRTAVQPSSETEPLLSTSSPG